MSKPKSRPLDMDSAATRYPGPLNVAEVAVKERTTAASTKSHRPGRANAAALQVPSTWIDPARKYVLTEVAGPNGIPNTGSRLARDKFDRIVAEWFPN